MPQGYFHDLRLNRQTLPQMNGSKGGSSRLEILMVTMVTMATMADGAGLQGQCKALRRCYSNGGSGGGQGAGGCNDAMVDSVYVCLVFSDIFTAFMEP